jgi:hypothetical protein
MLIRKAKVCDVSVIAELEQDTFFTEEAASLEDFMGLIDEARGHTWIDVHVDYSFL